MDYFDSDDTDWYESDTDDDYPMRILLDNVFGRLDTDSDDSDDGRVGVARFLSESDESDIDVNGGFRVIGVAPNESESDESLWDEAESDESNADDVRIDVFESDGSESDESLWDESESEESDDDGVEIADFVPNEAEPEELEVERNGGIGIESDDTEYGGIRIPPLQRNESESEYASDEESDFSDMIFPVNRGYGMYDTTESEESEDVSNESEDSVTEQSEEEDSDFDDYMTNFEGRCEDSRRAVGDVMRNPKNLLVCIQYEVIQRRPIFNAYEHFCMYFGNDAMTYNDFDFWYHRFRNGQFDMDYDRSKDPKLREMSDLPIELVEMIIEKLKKEDRYALPLVSKAFHDVMDNLLISELVVNISFENFELTFNRKKRIFNAHGNETIVHNALLKEDTTEEGKFKDVAFKELGYILKNSKLQFESFRFGFKKRPHFGNGEYYDRRQSDGAYSKENYEAVETFFKSLPHQIHTKTFHTGGVIDENQVLSVLPYLKPKVLEEITIHGKREFRLGRVLLLDQFKQAKSFSLNYSLFEEPIESLFHFNQINITIRSLSVEEVMQFKDAFLSSSNFESCTLRHYNFGNHLRIREVLNEKTFPYSESNESLHILVTMNDIQMKRVPNA